MRALRILWRGIRGWWLLTVAAAAAAVLAALGRVYPGAVAAVLLAVGGALTAAVSDRGRRHLEEQAERASKVGTQIYSSRVDQVSDPIRLGVHPAAAVKTADGVTGRVPLFVKRDSQGELEAAMSAGGFVLVVGDSTAGKTRLAYEAMRACLPRYTCVKPENSDSLAVAIMAAKDARPSVLWLDDLERYMGAGGLTQADVADLLDGGFGNVLILATMRAHEREDFSSRHDPSRGATERQMARAGREVLQAVTAEIRLARLWSVRERESAANLAYADPRIDQALNSADRHGLAEYMAAGPQMLQDLRDARSATPGRIPGDPQHGLRGGPRAAALITAAIDARRAGYHRPIPLPLLRDVHEAYLRDWGGVTLRPESWDDALGWATVPLHATSSLLEPIDDGYLAFDYLVDVTARDLNAEPVPDTIWRALLHHADPADAVEVAWQASFAGHIDHVESAIARARVAEDYRSAAELANCLGDAGRESRAVELIDTIIVEAEDNPSISMEDILVMREALVWQLGEKVEGHGDAHRALEIARQVVRDSTTIRGAAHPKTLHARILLARQVGAEGAPDEALSIAREVDAEAAASLGADHETTLNARFEVAVWTRTAEGAAAGAELFSQLIQQAERLDPQPWSLIVDSLWNLGSCLSDLGEHDQAIEVSEAAVADARNAYGEKHVRVLQIRLTHGEIIGLSGNPRSAVTLCQGLADECGGILDESHITTLEARRAAAYWTAAAGEVEIAVQLYEVLQNDLERLLDDDHWLVGRCRVELAELNQQT